MDNETKSEEIKSNETEKVQIDENKKVESIREDLVSVAVKFLQNPKVEQTTIDQRKKFLKSKGLTDVEITEAISRSRPFFENNKNLPPPQVPPPLPQSYHQQLMVPQPPSLFTQIKDGLLSIALFSSLIYGAFLFYKRYIYPLLFGTKPKPKRKNLKDEIIEEISDKVLKTNNDMHQVVIQIKQDVASLNEKHDVDTMFGKQLEDLKSEISSVKSLLLGKKQFPTVANSPVVPPSIPAWQLSNAQAAAAGDETNETEHIENDKSEELIEMGSAGSHGSSETEIVTKNSDSSIEIM